MSVFLNYSFEELRFAFQQNSTVRVKLKLQSETVQNQNAYNFFF